MHIIEVFPHEARCSCGNCQPASAGGEARRKASMHAEKNPPSIIIDRRLCSKKCLDDLPIRDIKVALHDEDCSQSERTNNA